MHRIRLPDGRRRRITIREAARLQSFPDWFKFTGSETDQYYQMGNAVAPLFAKALAQSVIDYLDRGAKYTLQEVIEGKWLQEERVRPALERFLKLENLNLRELRRIVSILSFRLIFADYELLPPCP